jgi:hypothetical protein
METTKDSNVSEGTEKRNASNGLKLNNKKGEGTMDTGTRQHDHSKLYQDLAESPLREARYEIMRRYLEEKGICLLGKGSLNIFPHWTLEQIEQAMEDVIRSGYAEVKSVYIGGVMNIVIIDKREKANLGKQEETL